MSLYLYCINLSSKFLLAMDLSSKQRLTSNLGMLGVPVNFPQLKKKL